MIRSTSLSTMIFDQPSPYMNPVPLQLLTSKLLLRPVRLALTIDSSSTRPPDARSTSQSLSQISL